MASSTRPRTRSRSESIGRSLGAVPTLRSLAEPALTSVPATSAAAHPKKKAGGRLVDRALVSGGIPQSDGLIADIRSGRWMIVPTTSGTLLLFSFLLYLNYAFAAYVTNTYLTKYNITSLGENPFAKLWFISHPVAGTEGRYQKGLWDIAFLAHHILTFTFLRQSITLWLLRPLALKLGIRGSKLLRFQEQGYCILYWGTFGSLGLYVMHGLPTWYFNTSEFWKSYPTHWHMTALMKYYYLLQFSYWLQQVLILIFKIEKPRKDYNELVAHHCVTMWLIGWSYIVNLTYIGNAVFITMDVSDAVFATAKCINYIETSWAENKASKTKTEHLKSSNGIASSIALVTFLCVWTYLRHYLNFCVLWSVWFEWGMIPEDARVFDPLNGKYLAGWMRYQTFVPIALIQCLNLFWYFLIWRILIRAVFGAPVADDRSDDEAEDSEEDEVGEKKNL